MTGDSPTADLADLRARIAAIRDSIDRLEAVKDQLLALLENQGDLDPTTLAVWKGDVNSSYYKIVAAWEMLSAAFQDEQYFHACKAFLEQARSNLGRSLSEIRLVKSPPARDLESALTTTFETCWAPMEQGLKDLGHLLFPAPAMLPPGGRTEAVWKITGTEFQLPCAECGKVAVRVHLGVPEFGDSDDLVYEGITHACAVGLKHLETVYAHLDARDLPALHDYLRQNTRLEEGIDAYCPVCQKVYCAEHYNAREVWDEGFYDCTWGTCPAGHKRIIDD